MQKWILLALTSAALAQVSVDPNDQSQQQGGNQPQNGDQNSNQQTSNDQGGSDQQGQNTTDTSGNGDGSQPDQSLEELLNQTLDDLRQMSPEDRENFVRDFAKDADFEIDFGFNGGAPKCEETVEEGDMYCPNYVGMSTVAESDDIPTLLALIEQTCTTDNTTPPQSLGPLLCLGAVGSCRAEEFGWTLPEDNTKAAFEDFFNNVNFGKMTEFGTQEGKATLCYRDCQSAWQFWASCGNFELDTQKDPCEGLPTEGCYDPARPQTATVQGASSAGSMKVLAAMVAGVGVAMF